MFLHVLLPLKIYLNSICFKLEERTMSPQVKPSAELFIHFYVVDKLP